MRLIQMGIIGVKISLMQNQQVVSFVFVVNIRPTEGFTPLLAKDVFSFTLLIWIGRVHPQTLSTHTPQNASISAC